MVKCGANGFCQGIRSIEVETWSEHPSEAVCKENCRAVENSAFKNLQVHVQLTENAVGINAGSVKTTLNKYC